VTETDPALNMFELYYLSIIYIDVKEDWLELWRAKELYRFMVRKACRKQQLG
jgi:hypothetical protein